MSEFPRVTVVTPSYNQAPFLEETIRSVLGQEYPNLEYIIIDGGSTDGSVEIIRKYEKQLAYWVSEKDKGQSHAINKGFARATGEILAWLNSDDVYTAGAIHAAVQAFRKYPDAAVVYGEMDIINEASRITDHIDPPAFRLQELVFKCFIPQVATFFTRQAAQSVGFVREDLHFAMDYDLWFRLSTRATFRKIDRTLAQHRMCVGTKTVSQPEKFYPEIREALHSFFHTPNLPPSISHLEQVAYAFVLFNQALYYFQTQDLIQGEAALANALTIAPDLARVQRERVLRALVAFADPNKPYEQAAEFCNSVSNAALDKSDALVQLVPIALRRIQIIKAQRSGDSEQLAVARRLRRQVLLTDAQWLRDRRVRQEFLRLWLGEQPTARISAAYKNARAALFH